MYGVHLLSGGHRLCVAMDSKAHMRGAGEAHLCVPSALVSNFSTFAFDPKKFSAMWPDAFNYIYHNALTFKNEMV